MGRADGRAAPDLGLEAEGSTDRLEPDRGYDGYKDLLPLGQQVPKSDRKLKRHFF